MKCINKNINNNIGNDDKLVYDLQYCRILWTSSWLFFGTSIYTIYTQQNDLIVIPSGLFLTSINYWRHPRFNSWARTIDVYFVYISFMYQIIRCYNAQYIIHFFFGILWCQVFYRLSETCYKYKMFFLSTLFHSLLHLAANLSIAGINSGYIEPFCESQLAQIVPNRCDM